MTFCALTLVRPLFRSLFLSLSLVVPLAMLLERPTESPPLPSRRREEMAHGAD